MIGILYKDDESHLFSTLHHRISVRKLINSRNDKSINKKYVELNTSSSCSIYNIDSKWGI
jgi:hypothetical protein